VTWIVVIGLWVAVDVGFLLYLFINEWRYNRRRQKLREEYYATIDRHTHRVLHFPQRTEHDGDHGRAA
jgi:hypothetical protein